MSDEQGSREAKGAARRAPVSSAALATFDPADAVGPRTELDEEDARALVDLALATEGPGPALGCLSFVLVGLLGPSIRPSPTVAWLSVIGLGLGVSAAVITGLRFYRRAIALRGVDLDRKLRRKAYRFVAKRARRSRNLLRSRSEVRDELVAELLEAFAPRPKKDGS